MTAHLRMDVNGALSQLPGLPGLVSSALAATRDESVSRERVAELLLQHPGFSHRFAGLLSSPFFRTGESVDSVASACLHLDTSTLERMIIAASVLGQFPVKAGQRLDPREFWLHSVGVGVVAGTLAGVMGHDQRLAFTGGLLHDVGRLVLDVYFPREFQSVLHYQQRHDTWIRDAEVTVLGFDHCALGAGIAEQWALPADVTEVIRLHHSPESKSIQHDATLAVHIADVLTRGLQFGNPGDDAIPMLCEVAMKRLGANWDVLRQTLRGVDGQLPAARELVQTTVGAQASASA